MKEFELKYGCNPNQKPARIYMSNGSDLPIEILSGRPGYINFLDAFNSWQLVKELKEATGLACATSFKHVSPTSAAVGLPLSPSLQKACFVDDIDGVNDSPALSEADAGIAMSDGAAIAREIADVTICSDDLESLVTLKRISDGLMQRIHANYRFIISFNTGLIVLGVAGVLPPSTSALLHNISTLGIGLRSMRNLLP